MDFESLLKNLEREVSCSVCLEIFQEPRQLSCLHSFCLKCLNNIASSRAQNGQIRCPVCSKETKVPESGSFASSPSSFYINSLLEVLPIKTCDTSKVICGNCENSSQESSYCVDCGKFWCRDRCLLGHNILRENQDHRVVALEDFGPKDLEAVLKRPALCTRKHNNEVLKYFCAFCGAAACEVCLNTLHSGHNVYHLEKIAVTEVSNVEEELVKAQKIGVDLAEGIQKINQRSVDVDRCVDAVKKDVRSFVAASIGYLQKQEEELIAEAENLGKCSKDQLTEQKNQIRTRLKKLSETVKQTENLVKRATNAEIVQSLPSLKKNLEELFDCKDLKLTSTEKANVVFLRDMKFFEGLKSNSVIGRLEKSRTEPERCSVQGKGLSEATAGLRSQCVVTTKAAARSWEASYTRGDRVHVQLKCNADSENREVDAQIEDNKDGTYTASFLVEEPGKYNMSVMVNEQPVQGLNPFTTLEVKHRTFQPVLSFGREGTRFIGRFRNPWGLAVNERDEIVVADRKNGRVQVFKNDGKVVACLSKKASGKKGLTEPTGVAWGTDGSIIVSDTVQNKVQIFSRETKLITSFGEKRNLDGDFLDPHGVSVDSAGRIIVADTGNKRIQVFSPDERFLMKFSTGEGDSTEPMFCLFHNGRFVVSDAGEHCIKVFDAEGRCQYQFGTEGDQDGQFFLPGCLAVDKLGQLVVCDHENHRVQLFTLDGSGTFVAKFGKKGSESGQLNGPVQWQC